MHQGCGLSLPEVAGASPKPARALTRPSKEFMEQRLEGVLGSEPLGNTGTPGSIFNALLFLRPCYSEPIMRVNFKDF